MQIEKKFQGDSVDSALRQNSQFRVVELTGSTLVLKEKITRKDYFTGVILTGVFIWTITTGAALMIILSGFLWGLNLIGFWLYPFAVKRQIFIMDLNKSVIMYRCGAFSKLKRTDSLNHIQIFVELHDRFMRPHHHYSTTFYVSKKDHQHRDIMLQMDSGSRYECEQFQEIMCHYFKHVCNISDVIIKDLR